MKWLKVLMLYVAIGLACYWQLWWPLILGLTAGVAWRLWSKQRK